MPSPEVAFVTGAGSGIGRASALRLAERGPVALFDRSAEGLRETAAAIADAGGSSLEIVGDVTVEDEVATGIARTEAELGTLRAAVACAGIEVTGTVAEMPAADWHRVLAINLTGVFHTARHAVRAFEAAGGGAFVAISSDGGVQGASEWGAYCATKHGVIGLIRCMALDHGPQGIRSNAVCPALTQTPMADRVLGEEDRDAVLDEWTKLVPMGRIGRPEEIAGAVAYLVSDDASYVNGHTLVLDGGATAGYFL